MGTLRALKIGLWLTRWLPYPGQRLLYVPLGILFYAFRRTACHNIIVNQRQVLSHSNQRVSWLRLQWQALRVMINVTRNYHALLRLIDLPDDAIRPLVDLEGEEHLDAALARGRGAIILGAHMANYNILAPFAALHRPPAAAFVEPVQPRELFEFVSLVRGRTGLQLLTANREGAQAAMRLLRANGTLLVAGDRYLGSNGTTVNFFGRPATLPHGTVVLALRSGVPLIPATLRRRPRGRLLVQLRPALPLVDTGQWREDLRTNMQLVAHALEETIGGAPEQWIILNPVWTVPATTAMPLGTSAEASSAPKPPDGRRASDAARSLLRLPALATVVQRRLAALCRRQLTLRPRDPWRIRSLIHGLALRRRGRLGHGTTGTIHPARSSE